VTRLMSEYCYSNNRAPIGVRYTRMRSNIIQRRDDVSCINDEPNITIYADRITDRWGVK